MINHHKVGLSLSGGGYRAAAFHLGTLRKLDELGVLNNVDVLSTISGGSITGAAYCLSDKPFKEFDKEMADTLSSKSVIRYVLFSWRSLFFYLVIVSVLGALFILPFTGMAWLSPVVLITMITMICLFQFKLWPVSTIIEKAYDSFFFHNAKLSALCERPLLAIGSTNIETCRPFTFSKKKMEDSSYAYRKPPIKFKHEEFPISKAVMASSCVPFAFTPVRIGKAYFINECDAKEINPQLVDGGVYDNQGIQKITQPGSSYECDIIITSDAGNTFPFTKSCNNVFVLLIRTMDVFMTRIKNFQMAQHLYSNTNYANKSIAYFSLGWDIRNCIPGFIDNLIAGKITTAVKAAHNIPREWLENPSGHREEIADLLERNTNYKKIIQSEIKPEQLKVARNVGTNLTQLTKEQICFLSGHAAVMTELQTRLYCPELLTIIP